MRTDGVQAWARGSLLWRERDRFQFGHDRGKGEDEEEENTDVRDPVVSKEIEEKARARWRADAWPCRKGKAPEREGGEKESFQKG